MRQPLPQACVVPGIGVQSWSFCASPCLRALVDGPLQTREPTWAKPIGIASRSGQVAALLCAERGCAAYRRYCFTAQGPLNPANSLERLTPYLISPASFGSV